MLVLSADGCVETFIPGGYSVVNLPLCGNDPMYSVASLTLLLPANVGPAGKLRLLIISNNPEDPGECSFS